MWKLLMFIDFQSTVVRDTLTPVIIKSQKKCQYQAGNQVEWTVSNKLEQTGQLDRPTGCRLVCRLVCELNFFTLQYWTLVGFVVLFFVSFLPTQTGYFKPMLLIVILFPKKTCQYWYSTMKMSHFIIICILATIIITFCVILELRDGWLDRYWMAALYFRQ